VTSSVKPSIRAPARPQIRSSATQDYTGPALESTRSIPLAVALRRARSDSSRGDAGLGRTALAEAGVVPATARITVSRESPEDVGFREIFVSLDGMQIAILQHGDRTSVEVPSGPHRLRAHNTLFWKTHDIVIHPGEHIRFIAINRAGWGTFGMLFFLGAMPVYLTFERLTAEVPSKDG
jgi:hypothetical protein